MRPRLTASSITSWRRSREIVTLFSSASRNAWTLCSALELSEAPVLFFVLFPLDDVAMGGLSHNGRSFRLGGRELADHGVVVREPDLEAGPWILHVTGFGGERSGVLNDLEPADQQVAEPVRRRGRSEAIAILEPAEDGARLRANVEVSPKDQRAGRGERGGLLRGGEQLA